MKMREVSYTIQTNLDGSFDIIQNIKNGKIIANTNNEEAAKEITKFLNQKTTNK